ncbi:MAG: bacterioferritin [Calothrix sp. SM1_5_4]|nr:bacterioferritin [Calothrix sp. SM1_5_4]
MANENSYQNKQVLDLLGDIYKCEMAGINRYLHYSFMIMGYNRIPIQAWFRDNAKEAMSHAITIGEKITSLGGHPPVISAIVEETNLHSIQQLLEESLRFEEEATLKYKELVKVATELNDIALEEMARSFVREEVEHAEEVKKMLKRTDTP